MKSQWQALTATEVSLKDRLFEALLRDAGMYGGAIRPWELELLVRVFKTVRPRRSIEWGLGSGVSAAALGSLRKELGLPGKHIAMDPFQKECCDDQGLRCLAAFDTDESVEFHPVFAEDFLVGARARGEKFDFIFVDGCHDTGHKLMDACLGDSVLNPGGTIAFHDSFFWCTSVALRFLVEERGYELVETGVEASLRRRLRGLKHARRLGWKYAFSFAPRIDFSLSFLRKPANAS